MPAPQAAYRTTGMRVLRSEWIKTRSLRSTWIAVAAIGLVVVGFGVLGRAGRDRSGMHPRRSPPAAGTACGWAGSHTAHLDQVLRATDLVVAVCDNAHENLDPHLPRLHWSIPDPVRVGIDEAFDAAYDQINRRIHLLVDATPAGPANESRILP